MINTVDGRRYWPLATGGWREFAVLPSCVRCAGTVLQLDVHDGRRVCTCLGKPALWVYTCAWPRWS